MPAPRITALAAALIPLFVASLAWSQGPASTQPSPGAGGNVVPLSRGALEERTPLKGIRKRIFENMARSKQKAAHFTFVEECDVSALKALRARLKPSAEAQGVKIILEARAAFRAGVDGDSGGLIEDEHEPVAIEEPLSCFFRRHGKKWYGSIGRSRIGRP